MIKSMIYKKILLFFIFVTTTILTTANYAYGQDSTSTDEVLATKGELATSTPIIKDNSNDTLKTADLNDILYYKYELENEKEIIKYQYLTNKIENNDYLIHNTQIFYEDITKRQANAKHFLINDTGLKKTYISKIYTDESFKKINNIWYQTETATTTFENYEKQIITLEKISYEKNNHFINYALADSDSIFSGVGDGYVYIEENTDHWEDVHDASSGDSAPDTETSASVVSREHGSSVRYYIFRGFIPFTIDLGAGANISSVNLNIYGKNCLDQDNDEFGYINVVETFQTLSTELVVSDFEDCGSDNGSPARAKETPIQVGADTPVDLTTICTDYNKYFTWNLNATGLSWIPTNGIAYLGLREGHDINDEAVEDSANNWLNFYTSEETGTDKDPYLEITYIISGGGGTSTLPVNGFITSDELGIITSEKRQYTSSTGIYVDTVYKVWHVPFFIFTIFAIILIPIFLRITKEIIIRLRK